MAFPGKFAPKHLQQIKVKPIPILIIEHLWDVFFSPETPITMPLTRNTAHIHTSFKKDSAFGDPLMKINAPNSCCLLWLLAIFLPEHEPNKPKHHEAV